MAPAERAAESGEPGPSRPHSYLPETRAYRVKRALLGKPLVTESLADERLSLPVALGVLAPDCISSTAYGTEEILTILVPAAGLAAFSLIVPLTLGIIVVLFFVTLSYREVVMVYTRAGGSYVVARDNFGPRTAQVAAVALLIDYTVTVAVQTAAGTDALTSAVPALTPYTLPITLAVVVVLLYGNLRGIREAGRAFALPTYLFIAAISTVVIVGIVKYLLVGLPHAVLGPGHLTEEASHLGHTGSGHGLLLGVSVFLLLKAFANGGSSLTGLEAISNGVGAFKPPEGAHARRALVIMAVTLGCLVLGVSVLAYLTHATPYASGTPTVLSQEAKVIFGSSGFGTAVYGVIQAVTLLILYTGANTSFNGFPFLASFVADDRFLPAKLTKRGHRLVFSNGIIVLAIISLTLLTVTGASVNALVAVYAIGVFTGFTVAGAGMVKHHLTHKEAGWRHRSVINGSASALSFAVVVIFAVTKFTEGAWVVLVLFPVMWFGLVTLNRRYRDEASVLGETAADVAAEARPLPRTVALLLIDRLDLATARAIQYAKTLNVDELLAVHFVIDAERASRLQARWVRLGLDRLPLELVECPDRRVVRACLETVEDRLSDGRTSVTVLLPRRSYKRAWSRFLHDATGERIAAAVSRLPNVSATIVPFDVDEELAERRRERKARGVSGGGAPGGHGGGADLSDTEIEERAIDTSVLMGVPGTVPIRSLQPRQRAKVAGRIRSLTVQPWGSTATLECVIDDGHGRLVVAFLGRRQIAGLVPGARISVEGTVSQRKGRLTMTNPDYEFVAVAHA
ncbi:MAG TPA: amino acid permease [Acidimicrobiales bacterium]|nr:amino acid permease [Acidimicrobiales bacterium]